MDDDATHSHRMMIMIIHNDTIYLTYIYRPAKLTKVSFNLTTEKNGEEKCDFLTGRMGSCTDFTVVT